MKNYAESIANLYLRLNGFFLLNNYISHKDEADDAKQHFDSDILGIRPMHVSEHVGLQSNEDVDKHLLDLMEMDKLVGVICEVKGGENSNWKLTNNLLEPCVKRLGLVKENELNQVVNSLKENPSCSDDSQYQIIKLIASDNVKEERIKKWNHILLSDMVAFIVERLNKYQDKKQSWHYNDSQLFQFLIYQNRDKNA